MSITTTPIAQSISQRDLRPSFIGIVGGELFKIRRLVSFWVLFILALVISILPYPLFMVFNQSLSANQPPLEYASTLISITFTLFRAFSGFALIVLTTFVIGLEYQQGTIRLLLGRGVGKVQLLVGKLTAIAVVALIFLIIGFLIHIALLVITLLITGGTPFLTIVLTPDFLRIMGIYALTIMISMGVTILLAAMFSVIGRSIAFGLAISLIWFPADNIGVYFMMLATQLTNNTFWVNFTTYWLGPNLNQMASALIATRPQSLTIDQITPMDGTHTLLVTLAYAIVFIAVALIVMWRRDVKE